MKKTALTLLSAIILISCGNQKQTTEITEKQKTLDIINKVNKYWQMQNPTHGDSFWHRAAYHVGNMEAFKATQDSTYLQYTLEWANQNEWKGAKSEDKDQWKYTYGETDEYVLFGDFQTCFQVYADLYNMDPQPYKIRRATEVMEYQMATDYDGYWWWADGLFMVMPVMTKYYNITGDSLYLNKLKEYLNFADSIMLDKEENLYYRDAKYIYPAHKSVNEKKDFWARGDGWVFAAFAKVIDELPADDVNREFYINRFKNMAQAIASCQQPEGYWTRSMLDPEHAPGPETSGTAFFTYGFSWGVNNGILDASEYNPVIDKAWNYLTTQALLEDGKLGFVQPIGEKAIPGQVVDANSTADFGVGAFLLAATEKLKSIQ